MSFLKNRTVVGVICILLSLLICFGLTPLFNRAVSQKAEIIRVVQPIRPGTKSPRVWSRPWKWAATICQRMCCGRKRAP